MESSEKIILTLTKHQLWGSILQPVLVKEEVSGYFTILEIAGSKSSGFSKLNDLSKEIVRLTEKISDKSLIKSYSKEKNIADFHKNVTQDSIEKFIRPCIEGYHRKIIHALFGSQLPLYIRDNVKTRVLYESNQVIIPQNPSQVVFNFKKDSDSGLKYFIHVKFQEEEFDLNSKSYFELCSDPAVLVVENKLLVFSDIDIKKLIPFFSKKHIDVPSTFEKKYIKTFVLNCVQKYEVHSEGIDIHEIAPIKQATLSLESDWNMMPVLMLNFKYGEKRYALDSPFKKIVFAEELDRKTSLSWFYPDKEWEKTLMGMLLDGGLEKSGLNYFSIKKEDQAESPSENMPAMIDWLRQHSGILKNFDFSQNLPDRIYFTGEISVNADVVKKQDWFDIRCIAIVGEFKIPFGHFRNHILNNNREFVLPDGTIAILPLEWFSRYYELMLYSRKSGDDIRLKKYHYRLLGSFENTGQQSFSYLVDNQNLPAVPEGLYAELRKYQHTGFSWLVHLFENNFGGCLADDMGLGKTLQTIALLQYISSLQRAINHDFSNAYPSRIDANSAKSKAISSDKKSMNVVSQTCNGQLTLFDEKDEAPDTSETVIPSLIVMPTSLLHNWQNELKRFAPKLSVYVYSGAKRLKSNDINKVFRHYDVVLTTYGTLRNDIEILQSRQFHHLILDESQYVKNPDSLSYKSVKQIDAMHKLVLTGTPIENSLTDLWAQLNIVNEGMLGSYNSFKKVYINPINKNNKEKEEALIRMIQPFILRRTKDEVAPELPPLSEETVYCDMGEEQQTCYNIEKNKLRNSLIGIDTNLVPQNAAFLALQGLTRMRLLANHPVLMDPGYIGGSGKFDQIIMHYETLKSEGHKVLIFSSFVKHLRLLSDYFDKENWNYAWLSGKTAESDREKEINKFKKQPDVNCFFISLKAGGVGLNLTAADYVFIIDPWWNPAAEMQALSRSHRIGQDKKVMVYRFISSETIEEKIRRLQESKSKLAETFVTSNNPLSGMNREEIGKLLD